MYKLNLQFVVLREDFVFFCDSVVSAFCPMLLSAWSVELIRPYIIRNIPTKDSEKDNIYPT